MSSPRPLYTVETANAALPLLQHELELIRESLAVLRKASASLPPGSRMDDGATPLSAAALQQLHGAERRLAELGAELKDVEQGLFDLPGLRGDRVVFLCWKEGEAEVAWFHDLTAGFSGRQPLRPETPEETGLASQDEDGTDSDGAE